MAPIPDPQRAGRPGKGRPSPDQPTPDQPTPDEAPTVSDAPTGPAIGAGPAAGAADAAAVNTLLDGYFWERRRRRAALPVAVGVLGLTALGLVQELPLRHGIEQNLTDRSSQALRAAGVDGGIDVRFEGRDGTITGTVTSPAERDSAVNAVRHVQGVRVAHDRLTGPGGATTSPKPTTPPLGAAQFTVELSDGRLTLTGAVPSGQVRAELISALRAAIRPDRISSRISVDGQVSAAGLDGLAAVLRAVGPDASVTLELHDGRLTLTGTVASTRQLRQAVAAGAAVTADPQRVVNRLTVDPRLAVAAALRALPPVTFRTAYSTPTDRDEVIIRRLAAVLRANPGVRLQVQGFTDDVGDSEMNFGLSYARARTVYLELQRLGVARQRLSFRAFGERNPKLPNTTPDNRAANRRVEFVLTPR
jgi:outer membrane protein OmpA-like peptidoglycan-associated protein